MFRKAPVYESRTYLLILTYTTQYSIHGQMKVFFDGLVKGVIDVIKYKGSRYILSRLKTRKSGHKPP